MPSFYIGVDLGGTTIHAGLVREGGSEVERELVTWKTEQQYGPDHVIARIAGAVRDVLARTNVDVAQVAHVGIGFPGPVDPHINTVSAINLKDFTNIPLRRRVQEDLGLPVWLENDGNVAALAEHRFGAGRGSQHLIYVTLSTGIGGGVILNGRLYTGASGAAAELGHQTVDVSGPRCNCGNQGCWEALASGIAIARAARAALDTGQSSLIRDIAARESDGVSARTVFLAATQGDPLARSILERASFFLGVGLANLINLFNPEIIVIGGGMSKMGDLLLGPALEIARARAFEPSVQALRVRPAELGDQAGVLGAAALGMEAAEAGERAA